MGPRRDSAVTLIEILLAVFIAAAILALVIPIFVGTSRNASIQTGVDIADRAASRVLNELRSEMRAARVVEMTGGTDLPAITYRLPEAGSGLDVDGAVAWGPRRTLAFEVVATLDEGDRGIDYNGDGDRTDRFFRCQLRETVDGGASRAVSASRFILNADAPHGDVDGDGEADAPFVRVTGGLRIVLWALIREDVSGLRRARMEVTMRNPQGT
jgi:type II secretory pathway pseudopilin PulG